MIDCGEGTGLALESREPIRIRLKRRRQNLDRHLAPEPQVARTINLPHSAGAKHADQLERSDARTWRQRHAAVTGSMECVLGLIAELDSVIGNE